MMNPSSRTGWRYDEQHRLPQAEDRRSTNRFGVEFHTLVSEKSGINDQVGMILDLSLSGCQVRVPIMVYPKLTMELRICAPNLDPPLCVKKAVVQWVKGDTFGLQFLVLDKEEVIRLAQVIARLEKEQQEESDTRSRLRFNIPP